MTNRRTFIRALVAGILVAPFVAAAQPAGKVARIGWLTPEVLELHSRAFRDAMRALGYADGQMYTLESRSAENDLDRLPALAAQLVQSRVDVIVAVSPPAIVAARQATDSIPIVMAFWGGGGLIESGMVASLARPGGNVTGVSMLAAELEAKRLEILLQAVTKARKIGVLDPEGRGLTFAEIQQVAEGAGAQLRVVPVGRGNDSYQRAFDSMVQARVVA